MLPRPTTLEEWGKVFTDVSLWSPVVREILNREGLECTDLRAGFPGSNAVFQVDDAYVIKIFAPMFQSDYDKELRIYRLLAEAEGVRAPSLIASGWYDDSNSWPYLITSFCAGMAIRDVRLQISDASLEVIAGRLGRTVSRLHHTQLDKLLNEGWQPLTRDAYFRRQIDSAIDTLQQRQLLAPVLLDALRVHLEAACANLSATDLRLVHADLTEDHLLLVKTDADWSLSALIDFADAEIAPYEYEWIPLWFSLFHQNVRGFQSFMRAYDPRAGLDEAWRDRMLAMTFFHRFGPLIVEQVLGRQNHQPKTLSELKDALWPATLLDK